MLEQLVSIFQKYRQGILYLFFGGLTTAVNYIVYICCFFWLPFTATTIPNIFAWIVAVLFAYLTNRIWVFQSTAHTINAVLREVFAFAVARIFSLLLESVILWIAVDQLQMSNLLVKLAANILVIVLNYLFSRFWIFKKKEE